MRGRCPAVILLVGAALFSSPRPAYAHRLDVDYSVLPGRRVQVESWFDPTGNYARAAHVQVVRADGTALAEGTMNDQGVFVFTYDRPQPLKIIVSAGAGHRAEREIPADELGAGGAESGDASSTGQSEAATNAPPIGTPRLSHKPRETWQDILTGIGFLLALAAFILSVRNARHLRQLRGEASDGARPR